MLTVLWAKVGTALQGRLLRLSPLKGLAATGAVGHETMEAVRAAIAEEVWDLESLGCLKCRRLRVRRCTEKARFVVSGGAAKLGCKG